MAFAGWSRALETSQTVTSFAIHIIPCVIFISTQKLRCQRMSALAIAYNRGG